jgi:hypothetical protein
MVKNVLKIGIIFCFFGKGSGEEEKSEEKSEEEDWWLLDQLRTW